MPSTFFLVFAAAQLVGGVFALKWLSSIEATSRSLNVWKNVARVTMVMMLVAAVVSIGEISFFNATEPAPLHSV